VPRLDDSLTSVIGGSSATALKKAFGMRTVEDLLRHYPRRYAERGELTDISSLEVGEHVTVMAEVKEVRSRPMRERRGGLVEVVVTDGKGQLSLTFFNQPWLADKLRVGRRGLFSGKVGEFRRVRQLTQPDHVLLPDDEAEADSDAVAAFARPLIPVYPAASAVSSWRLARAVTTVLEGLEVANDHDPLPAEVRREHELMGLAEALVAVHRPDSHDDVKKGRERLRWDEAFVLQVVLAQRRLEALGDYVSGETLQRVRAVAAATCCPALAPAGVAAAAAASAAAAAVPRRPRADSDGSDGAWGPSSPPTSPSRTPCIGCCRVR